MEFAIVDIETTGSQYAPDAITEIGIVITDGKRVLDTYETLVNPQSRISKFVQNLTGINEEMVADAPVFSDVASEILNYLEGRVFVAHNVNFDYKIIKQHFDNVGISMPSKRLCTIRLSRKILPDLPSYGLGKISACLGLKHQNAHRAMGDAQVTAELFHILFDKDETEIHNALKSNSKESTLPANLKKQTFEDLPNGAGIYYFHNTKGKIIYIGKAKNIKKRVASHFTGKNNIEKKGFLEEIHDISYELTGNEVVASLLEEAEIKQHWPQYNYAQKSAILRYGVYKYEDQNGNTRIGINKINSQYKGIMQFPSMHKARVWLTEKVQEFNLNPTFCGLSVFDDHSIDLKSHQKNIKRFLAEYLSLEQSIIWQGPGRNKFEYSFVLMEKGIYRGFGFIDKDIQITELSDLYDYLTPQHDTIVVRKILASKKYNNLQKKVIDSKNHLLPQL